jgi:hypothetical protein
MKCSLVRAAHYQAILTRGLFFMLDAVFKSVLPPVLYPVYPTIALCCGALFLLKMFAKFNAPHYSSGWVEIKEPKGK